MPGVRPAQGETRVLHDLREGLNVARLIPRRVGIGHIARQNGLPFRRMGGERAGHA